MAGRPATNPHSPSYQGGALYHYNKLKPRHQDFVKAMIEHNYNQTQAYLAVYPDSSYEAARSSSSELLTNPTINAAIAERRREREARFDISLDAQIGRLMDVVERLQALENPSKSAQIEVNKLSAELKALKELNAMAGHTGKGHIGQGSSVNISVGVVPAATDIIDIQPQEVLTDSEQPLLYQPGAPMNQRDSESQKDSNPSGNTGIDAQDQDNDDDETLNQ